MSDPVRFLTAFGHGLAAMALYPQGHPSRGKAIDAAHQELEALTADGRMSVFTFLDDDAVFGREPLRDLRGWEWSRRFAISGIERLEVEREVTRDELEGTIEEIFARVNPSAAATAENRQMRSLGIRFGPVDVEIHQAADLSLPVESVTLDVALGEEEIGRAHV